MAGRPELRPPGPGRVHSTCSGRRRRAVTRAAPSRAAALVREDPLWFKHAVFYEIHIRGFFDGNDDGSGDFRGLTEKLDYLQWLGVDCIWLLPMYPSPLRDGGYDIADFFAIHPDYGTVDDFRTFVDAAHERGMRVIADLVMNHTSSDHPWFQESRSSPDSPKRDWYVWSDTDERYPEARVIFVDTEPSNWTWDPVAGQYYWHRFFSHQPDLNFDNPEVQEAMLDVLRFWLDLGIDGFRLDAVPYLYERDGTNGENLPRRTPYLKRYAPRSTRTTPTASCSPRRTSGRRTGRLLRRRRRVPHGLPLPVMPRMFMALRREEAKPILRDPRPDAGDSGERAVGIFLRNHDELTLEMVTDEERDYMYAEYARTTDEAEPRHPPPARAAALQRPRRDRAAARDPLSLPGGPFSTTATRSAWATTCTSATAMGYARRCSGPATERRLLACRLRPLYLRPLTDPVFGFQAVNVEAQLRTPTRSAAASTGSSRCARSIRCSASALRVAAAGEPHGSSPTSAATKTTWSFGAQPRALGAGGRARPRRVRGLGAGGGSLAPPSRGSGLCRTCSRSRREAGSGSSSGRTSDDPVRTSPSRRSSSTSLPSGGTP